MKLKGLALALFITLILKGQAYSISFDIKPVRIFFDPGTRAEKLIVKNVSEGDLSLQIRVYRWSQNEKGEDIYDETTDIVVFPKMVRIKKGEEKIIRVGTKLVPGTSEKTYRIYVEEMPSEHLPEGATVRLLMRAGVPLFIAPARSNASGKIESLSVKGGKVGLSVKNDGNLHFVITSLNLKGEDAGGKELFSRELGGWYLLSGASRFYETLIPPETCADTAKVNIEIKTNRFNLNGKVDVNKAMCLP